MKKKAKACNTPYLVSNENKGGNHIFNFSAAMYELYKQRLCDHFYKLSEDQNSNIKINFKDRFDKSGATIETLMKVYQKSKSGNDRLKCSVNMYHTNTRIMVNGRKSSQFNVEHSKITDLILASEQVSVLNEEQYNEIKEGLRNISVNKQTSTIGFHLLWHTVELAMSTRLCLL